MSNDGSFTDAFKSSPTTRTLNIQGIFDGDTVNSKRHSDSVPPSTQLPSWMIREILDSIFSFLIPAYGDLAETVLQGQSHALRVSADRRTLLAAALTCHTLSGSALAALWNTMDSFSPIISLLPLIKVDGRYKFSQNPVFDVRSSGYLGCIRTFIFNDKTEEFMFDFTVQTALNSISSVLFPNLSVLIIPKFANGFAPAQRAFLPCLLASPIRDVVVGSIQGPENFEAFATVLAFRARASLRSISCSWNCIPRAMTSLASLDTVILTQPLSASTQNSIITHLSKFESLRRLEIRLSQNLTGGINSTPSLVPFFPTLEDLTISGDLNTIWHLLNRLTSPGLKTLKFRPDRWSRDFSHLAKCITSLLVGYRYRKRGWRSLEDLEIVYGRPYDPYSVADTGIILDDEAYYTFFKELSELRLVGFHFSLPAPLPSRISLGFMTTHFRNLHSLYLPKYREDEAPTFHDLYLLAQNAPRLRHLGTLIRTDPVKAIATMRPLDHLLDTLCVHDSKIKDAWYVAERLDQCFPYLRKIETTSPDYEVGWQAVERLLGFCQRSRRGRG